MGQPHRPEQAKTILADVLGLLEEAEGPEYIIQLPYRWRRM
jgi:hypothetical protein